MSGKFDFSTVMSKTDFNNAAVAAPAAPSQSQVYDNRVQRLNQRITRFFGSGKQQQSLTVRTGFLEPADKAELIADIEAKGYGCVENGNQMTIQ
jgi:hypothetical protein